MSSAPGLLALLAERDVHLSLADDGRLNIDMPTAAPLDAEELALLREHRAEIIAGLLAEPTAHCDRCGSPSWWRSPSSPTWACSYCRPRDRSRAEAVESLTLAGGQWAPGTEPPADPADDDRPLIRPADGRVQNLFGAWRTPAAHERIAAYDRHHWHCDRCIRAGRGYGDRCADGERLHERTRGTDR